MSVDKTIDKVLTSKRYGVTLFAGHRDTLARELARVFKQELARELKALKSKEVWLDDRTLGVSIEAIGSGHVNKRIAELEKEVMS